MIKRVLTFMFAVLLSVVGGKAEGIPSSYFSEVASGEFYLYNVTQQQFLVRLSNNFPGLTNAPAEVKVTKSGTAWTVMFPDGKYLKTGYWNNQYLWTDGTAGLSENLWAFDVISGEDHVYQIHRTVSETLNGQTGIFYINGTNAATQPSDDCKWALIKPSDYISIARGDASFLLPKIKAWNIVGDNIAKYDGTGENWDGQNYSTVGLVKVVNGTVSTVLNAMPAGTYRMVAAVRGVKNNCVTASVNGSNGSTVTLPGWDIHEMVAGTPCINTQGVQMPSNIQQIGYSGGKNTHGWMWASAEGTLNEPGTLSLSIALGADQCQVSNVYLYYLGDDVVRYTEGEELSNNGKTVMADIILSNPNTLIATDVALTTAANPNGYNNNLIDGNINSLVLFDGYDYEPVTSTAQHAVLHRNIAAGSWVTLSLPFTCTAPDGANVAELSNLICNADNSYTLDFTQNIQTMEGGKAYLFKSSNALSSFEATDAQLSSFAPTSVQDESNSAVATISPSYQNGMVAQGDYFISANKLYRCASETVSLKPFRASISLSAVAADSRLDGFVVDEETGLEAILPATTYSADIYDLTGRRVGQPRQGIYIINHKKTFIQ